MIEGSKTIELKKHTNAIHSASSMSLVQRKMANALLYNAYNDLLTQEVHSITIKELSKLMGYDSHDTQALKSALAGLVSTLVEWDIISDKKEEDMWVASSMLADATVSRSVCTYSYSHRMRQLLHRPEMYGRINMQVQSKFKSNYGLALYENCIRYQNIHYTPWLKLEVFRKLMGVEDKAYPIFRDFKRRILDKAIDEVNKFAPIFVTPEFRKWGRAVESIRFQIEKNGTVMMVAPDNCLVSYDRHESSYRKKLQEAYGLTDKQMNEVESSYEESFILEKISIIESSPTFINGKINNLAKYFIKALEEDYQLPRSSRAISSKKQKDKSQSSTQPRAEYDEFINSEIFKTFHLLDKKKKQEITIEFEAYLSSTLYLAHYNRKGLEDPLVLYQFYCFIKTNKYAEFKPKITFSEFSKNHSSMEW